MNREFKRRIKKGAGNIKNTPQERAVAGILEARYFVLMTWDGKSKLPRLFAETKEPNGAKVDHNMVVNGMNYMRNKAIIILDGIFKHNETGRLESEQADLVTKAKEKRSADLGRGLSKLEELALEKGATNG
jgi:hypothetical protein